MHDSSNGKPPATSRSKAADDHGEPVDSSPYANMARRLGCTRRTSGASLEDLCLPGDEGYIDPFPGTPRERVDRTLATVFDGLRSAFGYSEARFRAEFPEMYAKQRDKMVVQQERDQLRYELAVARLSYRRFVRRNGSGEG